jgi:HNH endonuclease
MSGHASVIKQKGQACFYCGLDTWRTPQQRETLFPGDPNPLLLEHRRIAIEARSFTVDHIVSRKRQGSNHIENKNPACKWCNNFKSSFAAKPVKSMIEYLICEGIHPHQIYARSGIWMRISPIQFQRQQEPIQCSQSNQPFARTHQSPPRLLEVAEPEKL